MDDKFRSKWIWISSLVFGVFAGLIKAAFFPYPEYTPPAIYPASIAFFITALLWSLLIARNERATIIRGGTVGAIVGLLTPFLMWPFFLGFLALSENRFPELFLWAPIYMLTSLTRISCLTALLGIALGVVLIKIQQKEMVNFEEQ